MAEDKSNWKADDFHRRMVGRTALVKAYLGSGLSLILAWGGYALKAVFNIDVLEKLHPERAAQNARDHTDSASVYLVVALLLTLILVPWSVGRARKFRRLGDAGKWTQGRIIAKSVLTRGGMVPTTVTYSVDGREYTARKDMLSKDRVVGDPVKVLYDPTNPERCELM